MTDETTAQTPSGASREEEIARKAAHLVKSGKPQLKKLIAFTRPRAELAGRQAMQYAREHENEIKDAALKLAQTRISGPLGMVVGQIASGMASGETKPGLAPCPNCATPNPSAAKFCGECGSRIADANPT